MTTSPRNSLNRRTRARRTESPRPWRAWYRFGTYPPEPWLVWDIASDEGVATITGADRLFRTVNLERLELREVTA